ncbi:hypothetical protein [Bradyrhizobium erythrophlei]|uniref:Uncharacterized protein n=1 Tax=Bradyrhizobium erythrophlei TaxID=1437360 RepID=A0A1M5T6C5_9BRAD|nr:hypothetical protein [Bradyrhizobium erythrophlei]SHH46289.1 hypothetical protein SAMN05444169_7582 [Bradyrhizobium erythrophlei]
MNWAWATSLDAISLDQIWRSQSFPMWLTLAAAGFFGIILLITLVRAEKSVANGALTVITLLAVGVAVAATLREFGPAGRPGSAEMARFSRPMNAALPALSCIDDLAGDVVLAACEKALFGSGETTAAAVSYAASQVSRLTAFGDVAAANAAMTPELETLRAAVERDRYGLMARVLIVRDHCTPSNCRVFRSLTDSRQIVANMEDRVYDGLIARYAPQWNMPAPGPVATLAPTMPTGKPTNADFPSAASTPPVSIMTPEPIASSRPPAPPPAGNAPSVSPSPRPPATAGAAMAAAKKKEAAPKRPPAAHTAAPVQLEPPPGAPAPAASND